MTALQWVNAIVVTAGVPSVVGGLLFVGRKLEVLDSVRREIHENIKPDLKDVRERFSALEGKTQNLFQAQSPIRLTQKGQEILNESGLKKYIDDNDDLLYAGCTQDGEMATSYDVQSSVFGFFDNYRFPSEVENSLKTYAFNQGVSMDAMRRIGAIYYRDICLAKLNFKPEDIDEEEKKK